MATLKGIFKTDLSLSLFKHWSVFVLLPQRASTVQVKALYDFAAEENDELGFCAGDIIEVLDHSDPSWWRGRLRGNSGLFPANYTMKL